MQGAHCAVKQRSCSSGIRDMHCFVSSSPSPAPLAAVTATARRPPSTLPILPVGRREHCLLLRLQRPGETTAVRRRGLAVVRAQNHRNVQPPFRPNHFAKETKLILRRFMKISATTFEGYLYQKAIEMSAEVCLSAQKALIMASEVEDSARLTTCTPASEAGMISADTVHLTLGAYVDVFVHTAEDSYHRRVTAETVTSFLNALRGLVSISHILLDDALEALSLMQQPRVSLAEYAYNYDVKRMRREFDWEMAHLEDGICKATSYSEKKCELALPAILEGVKLTESLLGLMAVRRQRALGKAKK